MLYGTHNEGNGIVEPSRVPAIDLRQICGYIRLPFKAMQNLGSSARTLGAVMDLVDNKNRSTFASVKTIAKTAGLSPRTVERHLQHLIKSNCLLSKPPFKRRTATYTVTPGAWATRSKFAPLPNWWTDRGHATSFCYAVILGQLCMAEHVADEQNHDCTDEDILFEYYEHLLRLSYAKIAKQTGLGRSTVIEATKKLINRNLINREVGRFDEANIYQLFVPPEIVG